MTRETEKTYFVFFYNVRLLLHGMTGHMDHRTIFDFFFFCKWENNYNLAAKVKIS